MTLIMLDYLQVVKRNAISRIDPGVESKPLPALSCADCHKGGRGWSHDCRVRDLAVRGVDGARNAHARTGLLPRGGLPPHFLSL